MIVKICGITESADGLAALDSGADMLGFNFHPASPRYVTPTRCARLVASLRRSGRPFTAVGIFVNLPPETIATLMSGCGLDAAQLSGDEPPEDLEALPGRAFKGVRPTNPGELEEAIRRYSVPPSPRLPALLLDAAAGGKYGGTGHRADWALAASLAPRLPILLAGGLTPDNVVAAVRAARPWGVDVASGVESSPGRKDPKRMSAFVAAAHLAVTSD